MRPLVRHPLIEPFWPIVTQAAQRHGNLGRALAEARHRLEGQWGLESLELPLSQVCDTETFRWFAAFVMGDAAHFRDIHNSTLAEYRHVNEFAATLTRYPTCLNTTTGWRSRSGFGRERPDRRAAFVRHGNELVLSDRRDLHFTLGPASQSHQSAWIEQLELLHRQGVRLRPRH